MVMRDGQPVAAVIGIDGFRALRHMLSDVVAQLGEERLRTLVGE